MKDISALRLYTRVARLGSFSAAARECGLSQSQASRIIADLEAELGVRLLSRTTRAVVPTEAGGEFLARIEPILAALDEAAHSVREGGELRGLLRISTPTSFGIRDVIPRLASFAERHPNLHIQLQLGDRRHDLVRDAVVLHRQRAAQRQDHEMRPGIGRREALREVHREAEAFVIGGVAQNEDGLPALLSRLLQPGLDQAAADPASLMVRRHGYRSQSQGAKRCPHARQHDVPGDDVFVDGDQRDHGIAVGPEPVDEARFVGLSESPLDDDRHRRLVRSLFGPDHHAGHHRNAGAGAQWVASPAPGRIPKSRIRR
jgi:Bacterial regulatory helix-turn-helix protein, lysR family/LysR substrate binding domain